MRPVLLYDGDCRFCRFAARLVVSLDRDHELALLPFADQAAAPLLELIPAGARLDSWHLLLPGGRRASRGRGAVELAGLIPVTSRLAPLLRVLPLDAIYDLVARKRRLLGRLVPDGRAPRRYP